jgi:hypothetical protein
MKMREWLEICKSDCCESHVAGRDVDHFISSGEEEAGQLQMFFSEHSGGSGRVISDEELERKRQILGVPRR